MCEYEMQNCVWVSLCGCVCIYVNDTLQISIYIRVYYHSMALKCIIIPTSIYIKLAMCNTHTAYYYSWAFLSHSRKCPTLGEMPTVARFIFSSAMQIICNFGTILEFFLCRLLSECVCVYTFLFT